MDKKNLNDCFAHDGAMLTHEQALEKLTTGLVAITGTRSVALDDAVGEVLAKPVLAPRNIPAHTNSAVDGYGFCFADYDAQAGTTFPVTGMMAAGSPLEGIALPQSAIRIFTGAAVPDGFETVVMQEDVELVSTEDGEQVKIPAGLKRGANVRLAGEDVHEGATVLPPNRRLSPQDLAAIASTGTLGVECFRPLKVAIFSTGDEVIRPGTPFEHGKVYDSNAAMLRGLVVKAGALCDDLGVLPDDAQLIETALSKAAQAYDVLLTSGGVSVGELDFVLEALNKLGSLHLWKIAIKPGRPMSFGQINNCMMLGLPGNPVAAFLCFLLYAQPVLTILSGQKWQAPLRYKIRAGFSMSKKTGRREFLRGVLEYSEDGSLLVNKYARDGSGLISSLTQADGFIELGEYVVEIKHGELVDFIPFGSFGL
ncbi:MAG: molybdopterin molybdotransferase MoeA [bacterium]|nr:molybdopterin molybdotransferase MoeA [bacterium]